MGGGSARVRFGGKLAGRQLVPPTAQLDAIKVAVMIEKYRTRDDDLQPREPGLGAGAIGRTESEWSHLIAMLELAQRWHELIAEFTFEDAHSAGGGQHQDHRGVL